jgi:hypothetical protein
MLITERGVVLLTDNDSTSTFVTLPRRRNSYWENASSQNLK